MPNPVGSPAYNPSTGVGTIVDTNELTYVSTTFVSGTIGSTALVVNSISGFSIDQYIEVGTGSAAEILQITATSGSTLTVNPAIGKTHTNGDPVAAKVARQIFTLGDPNNAANLATVSASGTFNPLSQTNSLAVYDQLLVGTWNYYSGVSGTVNISAGQRVLGITAYSTAGGSLTINGGSSIIIPSNTALVFNPLGNLTAPTLVFSSTVSYVVEVVT